MICVGGSVLTGLATEYDGSSAAPIRGVTTCGGNRAATGIQLQDSEVILAFTLYMDVSDGRTVVVGISMTTNFATYGHFGGATGTRADVRGYNLQYVAGYSGSVLDNLAFRFEFC